MVDVSKFVNELFGTDTRTNSHVRGADWQQSLLQSVDPEQQRKQKISQALAAFGNAISGTRGNFLQGMSAGLGAGANTLIDANRQAEEDRLKAMQLLEQHQMDQEDRRRKYLSDMISTGTQYNESLKPRKRETQIVTADGRTYLTDSQTGDVIKDIGAATSAEKTPASQYDQRVTIAEQAGLQPDDPRYQAFVLTGDMPRETSQRLTATDKNAILEADQNAETLAGVDAALAQAERLNDKAGSGVTAGWQSFAARNDPTGFFDDEKGQATTEYENLVMNQALSQMKAIFGGNPTEGERAVLLQLQASADKTPAERKVILANARRVAQRRMKFNQDRARELKSGEYFRDPAAPQTQTDRQTPVPDVIQQKYPTARQAPNGSWYIQKSDGTYVKVRQ